MNDNTRSVKAIFSTETPTRVFDWSSGYVITEVLIASGCQFPNDIRILDNHLRWSVKDILGTGDQIRIEGNRVIGRLSFADDGGDAEAAFGKVLRGHIRDVSVGYNVLDWRDIGRGQKVIVGGKEFSGGANGLRVTTEWELREISLTPMGADPNAKIYPVRSDAALALRRAIEGAAAKRPRESRRDEPEDLTRAEALEFLSISGDLLERAVAAGMINHIGGLYRSDDLRRAKHCLAAGLFIRIEPASLGREGKL